ncbi:uncharacterized protein LOC129741319 [Uranotaenia lowii]|uniref:uncharacterized protein LOC129741319 n=1 Tax=Uranotaenia lowii TaxID=190385 RepID=UPI00247A040A|nr:uncharacterized protein LOC129741319 [Uranotaenia lowii]
MGRFQQSPNTEHWQCLKRIVRYLRSTGQMVLEFTRNKNAPRVVGYADSDWAADAVDRKSISGFIFKVFGCTVSWSSKKQTTVATSSSEAEYVALSSASAEAIWLNGLLDDIHITSEAPTVIFEDNRGCIGLAKNLETKRSKHIIL